MYVVDLLQAVDRTAKGGPERGSAAAFVVRIPLLEFVFAVRRHLRHSEKRQEQFENRQPNRTCCEAHCTQSSGRRCREGVYSLCMAIVV